MDATKQANAAKAQQDAAIKTAADAARAKSPGLQSPEERLAILKAKQAGIREAEETKLKKKVVAEFHSKFLGRTI